MSIKHTMAENVIAHLFQKKSELQDENEKLAICNSNLNDEICKQKREMDRNKINCGVILQLENSIETLTMNKKTLQDDNKELELETYRLNTEKHRINSDVITLWQTEEILTNQIATLNQCKESITHKVAENVIVHLLQTKSQLQDENKRLAMYNSNLNDEIYKQKREMSRNNINCGVIFQLENLIEKLNMNKKTTQHNNKTLEIETYRLNTENHFIKSEIITLWQKKEILTNEIETLNQCKEKICSTTTEKLKITHDTIAEKLKKTLDKLKSEISHNTENLKKMHDDKAKIKVEIEKFTEMAEKLKVVTENFQRTLSEQEDKWDIMTRKAEEWAKQTKRNFADVDEVEYEALKKKKSRS